MDGGGRAHADDTRPAAAASARPTIPPLDDTTTTTTTHLQQHSLNTASDLREHSLNVLNTATDLELQALLTASDGRLLARTASSDQRLQAGAYSFTFRLNVSAFCEYSTQTAQQDLADVARHVIRCHSTQGTRVQTALYDMASSIWQALQQSVGPAAYGARYSGGSAVGAWRILLRETLLRV